MEPRYIVCWTFIYFEISSSLFQVALIDSVVRIRRAAPIDPVVGASSPEITTNGGGIMCVVKYVRARVCEREMVLSQALRNLPVGPTLEMEGEKIKTQ